MKVAVIQTSLFWENAQANRAHFQNLIEAITEPVNLIVLPEMFSTGFTMHPQGVAESMTGQTVSWLKSVAKSKSAAIVGSIAVQENDQYFNRLVFVFPSGEIQTYDKRHLFTLAGEDLTYTAGKQKVIVDYCGFKICLLVCYDLRFPVFSRNVESYDLLLYVANWPEPRINAWDILLPARAVENQCYVIGVNRIGQDGNNHHYVGHSQAIDYLGNYLLKPIENEQIQIVSLDKESMLTTRKKLAFLNDQDDFVISE